MQLTASDFAYLHECAITAAKQAGQIIEGYANKRFSVQHKPGAYTYAAQVVTEVDLLSEAAIVKILEPTCRRYDLALLSEERPDDKARLEKAYFWCIDPMDGTLSFVESTPGYAVSIALVSNCGIPHIGVVYDPVAQALYTALKGQGVLRNGISFTDRSEAVETVCAPLTVVYDRGFIEKIYYPQLMQGLESIASRLGLAGLQMIESNGAVLNACWVLEHPPAVYFKCPKIEQGGGSLWDFTATTCFFNELKFSVGDFYGQPLDLNRADSTYMNQRGVLFATDSTLANEIQGLLDVCMSIPSSHA